MEYVDYTTVVQQGCTNCDEAITSDSLYNQTTSDMIKEIISGNFSRALRDNAQKAGNAESLTNITNITVISKGYTVVTNSPQVTTVRYGLIPVHIFNSSKELTAYDLLLLCRLLQPMLLIQARRAQRPR